MFVVYFCQAKGDRLPTTQSGSGKKQADKKQVVKKQADKKPAEKKAAEKKPADKKPADKKTADKKPAEKKPADKKDKPGTMSYFKQEHNAAEYYFLVKEHMSNKVTILVGP